jgi:hypothetical protein
LPNTFLTPNARSKAKVASLTVVEALVGFLDNVHHPSADWIFRHCEERNDEAIHSFFADRWIASLRSQ